jgi:2,4-didehydro-3-deoxy-L-rhamnonate hydrolase
LSVIRSTSLSTNNKGVVHLMSFGGEDQQRQKKPGLIIGDRWYDVSAYVKDYDEDFFESDGLLGLATVLKDNTAILTEISKTERLGSPVARPSKTICIVLNYVDHCRETNAPIPEEPIIFFKSTTALCVPNDNLMIPKNSAKTDWEIELAFVIGKKASYVDEVDASNYAAEYCLRNDYSERAFQLERGGQWAKGKGCDTFAPWGQFAWAAFRFEIGIFCPIQKIKRFPSYLSA